MRVGIDFAPALRRSEGIGRFARSLVPALARVDPASVFVPWCVFFRGYPGRRALAHLARLPNVEPAALRAPARAARVLGSLFPGALARWAGGARGAGGAGGAGGLDLFHCTDFTPPPMRGIPVLLTVHDVAWEIEPGWYPPRWSRALGRTVRRLVGQGAWVLTVSRSSRDEIRDALDVPEERLHVAPLGVDRGRFRPPARQERAGVLARHGIAQSPYFLSVGTLQPRKNLEGLLAGFRAARAQGLAASLVVAGRQGWMCEGVLAEIRSLEREGAVRHLGYVDDRDLPSLYAGAVALCALSHHEGFGLPVLEAMASGTPVLVSRAGALVEVAGEAALRAGARSPEEIAGAMLRLARDEDLRLRLSRAGLARAAGFSWEECARTVRGVYGRMLGEGKERGGG